MNLENLIQSNIIDTLNLAGAKQEIKTQAMKDAQEIIVKSVIARIKKKRNNQPLNEFERLLEDMPQQEHGEAIKKYIPDIEEIVFQESMRYKYLIQVICKNH